MRVRRGKGVVKVKGGVKVIGKVKKRV